MEAAQRGQSFSAIPAPTPQIPMAYPRLAQAATAKELTLKSSHTYVQDFWDFHHGRGAFCSFANSEETLTMRISPKEFVKFKKLLHGDKGEER